MNNPNNIYYIIEIYYQNEKLYLYTKRVGVHFPDMAKKFVHRRSALRYFRDSEFMRQGCYFRILKYDKSVEKIIL